MSLKSLYTISDLKYSEAEFSASLRFNPGHEVFNGHFPGQPVVPGVVLINILKDLCSVIVGSEVSLKKGTNIKFLNMTVPAEKATYYISGTFAKNEDEMISMSANILGEGEVSIKFKGVFSKYPFNN